MFSEGKRWFIKYSDRPRGVASLRNAQHVYSELHLEAVAHLHNAIATPSGGLALVFDWLPGEVLYDYTRYKGQARRHPDSPHARFRALPADQILAALDVVYSVLYELNKAGWIAVDFYDGCILYDFKRQRTYLCDLDMFRPGPFILEAERLPGSRRFMAPEEFQRGARIDQLTNVFTLGRTALELLGDGSGSAETWKGSPEMLQAARRAASPDRSERFPTIRDFLDAWRGAAG